VVLTGDAPGVEYREVGLFFGNFITAMRISMGDFEIIKYSDYLNETENYLFWFVWLLTTVLT
jgi:hypothetical protein